MSKKVFIRASLVVGLILPFQSMAFLGLGSSQSGSGQPSAEKFNTEVTEFSNFTKSDFGVQIHFSKDWDSNSPSFSANAGTLGGKVIRVSGYDFRSSSLAAFRLGLCHELGHYLGGKPYLAISSGSIDNTVNRMELSAEGQSDYFASYCLKKYISYLRLESTSDGKSSKDVVDFCSEKNKDQAKQEQFKCQYVVGAGLDLVNYLKKLESQRTGSSYHEAILSDYKNTTPAPNTIVGRREYPTLNCRLKTYLAGTLCENDQKSSQNFVCSSGSGARPDCWYQGE